MKELLKALARDVVLPWALTTVASLVTRKLAPKPTAPIEAR